MVEMPRLKRETNFPLNSHLRFQNILLHCSTLFAQRFHISIKFICTWCDEKKTGLIIEKRTGCFGVFIGRDTKVFCSAVRHLIFFFFNDNLIFTIFVDISIYRSVPNTIVFFYVFNCWSV